MLLKHTCNTKNLRIPKPRQYILGVCQRCVFNVCMAGTCMQSVASRLAILRTNIYLSCYPRQEPTSEASRDWNRRGKRVFTDLTDGVYRLAHSAGGDLLIRPINTSRRKESKICTLQLIASENRKKYEAISVALNTLGSLSRQPVMSDKQKSN